MASFSLYDLLIQKNHPISVKFSLALSKFNEEVKKADLVYAKGECFQTYKIMHSKAVADLNATKAQLLVEYNNNYIQ